MDSTFITAAVQNEWNVWNVRGFMILSVSMQLVLALAAPLRRKTSDRLFIFVIWSAYLLADWAALFVFGLISNAGCRHSENNGVQVPPDLMVFWAAFLLIHLGGPDTITAFSMEDNALWMRHLVGLLAQLSVFLYIFAKTLPNNKILVPTVLIFEAGMIKYGERTRALYLASLENLKKTIEKRQKGFNIFHRIFKGLIVDITPVLHECNELRGLISSVSSELTYLNILVELNLLYELIYTKIKAANSTCGNIIRTITNYSTLVAFIWFCLADKHEFRGVDLAITYALFVGDFIIHVANVMMLIRSDFGDFTSKDIFLLVLGQGILASFAGNALLFATLVLVEEGSMESFINRRWSEKVGSFNMLSHCFKQCTPKRRRKLGFIWNKLARERHTSREDFDILLWDSVFEDIKEKAADTFTAARMRELYEARGDRALEESGFRELMPYIRGFQYDNTLLIWHVATEICINIEGEEDAVEHPDRKRDRIFSKKLLDYMMYLLVRQPKLMSAVAGISHIRYEDTCSEVKLLGRKYRGQTMKEFCESMLREHANIIGPAIEENDNALSVLKDSCGLVQLLRENPNRWEVIFKVWLELLSYAAGHCRVDSHVRLLSEGGEFITLVWMLMALWGIRDQFPVN